MTRQENPVLRGRSGTGKSHFLETIGQLAIDQDLRVAWFKVEDLGNIMQRQRIDDIHTRAIRRLTKADLICIDDIGLLPSSGDATEGFFRLILGAHEPRSWS